MLNSFSPTLLLVLLSLHSFSASNNTFVQNFEREDEQEALISLLTTPNVLVVTGPRDAGKSTIIKMLRTQGRVSVVANVDLRKEEWDSVEEFCDSFNSKFLTTFESFKKYLPEKVGIFVNVMGAQTRTEVLNSASHCHMNNALDRIISNVNPNIPKDKPLVVIIDEANKLLSLKNMKHGEEALSDLFNWFLDVTKQQRLLSVVLLSSDQFFNVWLQERHIDSYVSTVGVGDLAKDDAERFYTHAIVLKNKTAFPSFANVYPIVGGRMKDIQAFVDWSASPQGKNKELSQFPLVGRTRESLLRALSPSLVGKYNTGKPKPLWNKEHVEKLWKTFRKQGRCWSYKDEVEKELGDPLVVESLIQHNVFSFRPPNSISRDIEDPFTAYGRSIITVQRPVECYVICNPEMNILQEKDEL